MSHTGRGDRCADRVERTHAPAQLDLVGDETLLSKGPRVAVIGAREATAADGLRRAQVLAHALVRHDVIVVSGLAGGIDACAHRAAIEAGGRTIAVLGTPVDVAYPAENRALQEEIAREHLLVAQFAPGCTTTRASFPQRNRTMALLTDATVIVEAGEKSDTRAGRRSGSGGICSCSSIWRTTHRSAGRAR